MEELEKKRTGHKQDTTDERSPLYIVLQSTESPVIERRVKTCLSVLRIWTEITYIYIKKMQSELGHSWLVQQAEWKVMFLISNACQALKAQRY